MASMLQPEKTIGLERSKSFLSAVQARSRIPSVSFVEHDVTKMPLPSGGNADLIYARFLLAHLPNPERVVVDWATQLQPGGLLLEEVEWIWTEHPVFDTYIGIVAKMMANRGNELYVGLRLNTICEKEGLRRHLSRVAQLRPTTGQAARMFSMNLPNWRNEPFVRANYTDGEIDYLATELSKLSVSRTEGEIGWGLRHIAIERT
jgi:SAM-dependent methyltransferase